MKTWRIPVVWQEMGTVNIIANTLAEAMELAKDTEGVIPLPDNGSYLDGSWELATDEAEAVRELYNGNQEDDS